jgi:hypothetical protein
MSKESSKLKKAIDKIVKPNDNNQNQEEVNGPTVEATTEKAPEVVQSLPDLGQKTMPGILALRKKFGK